MKKTTKVLFKAIIAIAAVIGFSMTACDSGDDGFTPGGGGKTVAAPTATPAHGAVASGTKVTLSTTTQGAEIWYTTSGSAPAKDGTDSTKYTSPISITAAVTIKAIAVKEGMNDSAVLTAAYTIDTSASGLVSITAEYSSDNPIFPDTTLDTLRDGLTVKAKYSDDTETTLEKEDYELSGTLATGESVITVTYQEKTATFNVIVQAPHTHEWSEWEVITPATCTEEGEKTRNCTADPPHSETLTVDALGHDWGEWEVTTAATCLVAGEETRTCKRDKTHKETSAVDALGHDYGEWGQTKAPTCTEAGEDTRTCKHDSSYKETRAGAAALGHDYQWQVTKAATYTADGVETEICSHDSTHTRNTRPGDPQLIYTASSIAALGTWLASQPVNTAQTAFKVKLNVSSLGGSATTTGSLGTTLRATNNSNRFVNIDLSGSTMTSIEQSAFTGCSTLVGVTLPATVTSIGNSAFSQSGLISITIPDTVTSMGTNVFWACETRLESVTIGNGVTSIGDSTFYNCNKLTSVIIGDSVTSIGDQAFTYCSELSSITIGKSVATIADNAFNFCNKLSTIIIADGNDNLSVQDGIIYNKAKTAIVLVPKNITGAITLPDTLLSIKAQAFYSCTGLTGITIPNGVTTIGTQAFSGCTSLTEITIPNSVTTIGTTDDTSGVFQGCTSLASVTLPTNPGFTMIAPYLFRDCTSLTGITIPNSVNNMRGNAFYGAGLVSITIPNSVPEIRNSTFYNCRSLTSVTFEATSKVASIMDSAFSGCTKLESITIPDSVTSLGTSVFYNCTSLASVSIGSGVTSIGNNDFQGCTSLTSITIPNGVTSIGNAAFSGCTGLTSVSFERVGTTIGTNAFINPANTTSLQTAYTAGGIGTYTRPDTTSTEWARQE